MANPFRHIRNLKFYAWVSLADLMIGFLTVWVRHSGSATSVSDPGKIPERFVNITWMQACLSLLIYCYYEYLLANFRFTLRKIIVTVLLSGLFLFLSSVILVSWRYIGIGMGIFTVFSGSGASLSTQAGDLMGTLVLFGIVRHIYNHILLKRAAQQLRIEKQEAELNYLKSQTNPHFLFNTLNNIYSLSRDKSDLAPESILRLSKILRYMLYETGGAYIAIEQELKIMNDYIALESLRYDDTLRLNFNHDVEDMKQALPPLLLIPLVENAFKHGVSETRNRPFVDIHLSVRNRQLNFSVKNSSEGTAEDQNVKENIGLSNLRRQLELLYTDYKLSVQQGESVFTALLQINLASHV